MANRHHRRLLEMVGEFPFRSDRAGSVQPFDEARVRRILRRAMAILNADDRMPDLVTSCSPVLDPVDRQLPVELNGGLGLEDAEAGMRRIRAELVPERFIEGANIRERKDL